MHGGKNLTRDPVYRVSNPKNPMNLSQFEQIMDQCTIKAGASLVLLNFKSKIMKNLRAR